MDFSGKTIVLGITGGVAAYRACDLIRELYRRQAQRVICVMTPAAEAFITPLTLQSLSQQPVHRSELAVDASGIPVHITLAQQADAMLILPASTNTLAKLAHGLADNLLTTTAITLTGKPVLLAPAMNTRMWMHPLTQRNLATLEALPDYHVIRPTCGHLACGETGEGHLAEQETVLQALYRVLHPDAGLYQGVKVVVTAGGTQEPIDPVRHISNRSSGKMGIALADELWAMGAEVTLLATEASIPENRMYPVQAVQSTAQLQVELENRFPDCDMLFMAAAVSDFSVANTAAHKLKRAGKEVLSLELRQNPDLIAVCGQRKRANQFVVGFAAESQDLLAQAGEKLRRKNLNAIVANDISRPDIGFDTDENEVTVLLPSGETFPLPKAAKPEIAREILRELHQPFIAANTSIVR